MMASLLYSILLIVYGVVALAHAWPIKDQPCSGYECLEQYVNQPDSTYKYKDTGLRINSTIAGQWTGYVLNMTSQTWLTAQDSDRSVWFHIMVVIVPSSVTNPQTAFMYIDGGGNSGGGSIPGATDDAVLLVSQAAMRTGTVGTILKQIPNQAIIFTEDPEQRGRSEDSMIAFTWHHFINDPTKPEWLARMPMTKAGVRAMDTVTDFTSTLTKLGTVSKPASQFIVAGASKRGWTTWTLAAVDDRVVGAIPIVMDELNFIKNVHHHWRAYGGWSFAFEPYWEMNITKDLDHPNTQLLAEIVDPYFYIDKLDMPKLVINGAMDEFFLPDDSRYWWSQLPEPKHFAMLPNTEHAMVTGLLELLPAVTTWARALLQEVKRPSFTWTIDDDAGDIVVEVDIANPPLAVTMWAATTCNSERRDFRIVNLDDPCTCGIKAQGYCANLQVIWRKTKLTAIVDDDRGKLTYLAHQDAPPEGKWTAFLVDLEFDGPKRTTFSFAENRHSSPNDTAGGTAELKSWPVGRDGVFEFTTEVAITPNTFPFEDCIGEECLGELV